MSDRKKGNIVVFGFIGAVVLTAAMLGSLVFMSPSSKSPSTTPVAPSSASEGGMIVNEAGELVPFRPEDEVAAPAVEDVEPGFDEYDAEAAAQAARELVGGEPIPCESPCDCPQGQACQPGSQLCLPSPFPVYCCEKDGCPDGQFCVNSDGGFGVCGN